MKYEFFFSYTRANNDSYLQQFFDDLSQWIRDLIGLPKDAKVGFFDQREVELGEEWEETIKDALQTSKVMVCIYSPGYFNSEYCGKEWTIFHMRRHFYKEERQNAGEQNVSLPQVIKPILWIPGIPENINDAVLAAQYKRGDPDAVYNRDGLKYVLKQLNNYLSIYNDFVKDLAQEILDAAKKYPVPPLNNILPLKAVEPVFPFKSEGDRKTAYSTSKFKTTGPKHIRFVFVAANPNSFGNARSPEPYLDNGGSDWKPYFPDASRIGPYVQNIVSANELGFTSDELLFSNNIIADIEKAQNERKIVILIIDSWTVDWQTPYQDILREFDERNFINCSVLVPWNENDRETALRRTELEMIMRQTFDFRANLIKNSIFYRDSICSWHELRDVIRDVVTRIKAEIHKRADVVRPLQRDINKPIIRGPGS